MPAGRPQKSAAAMELGGTVRHDRPRTDTVQVETLTKVPAAPEWLAGDKHAVDEWDRLAPILVRQGLLAAQDLNTLANCCLAQAGIIRRALGEPEFGKNLHANYIRYAAALGLAAAWRSRVKTSGKVEEPKNAFAKFKAPRPN